MHVGAVIVCKDYSDFLDHTLPENVGQLDDVVVVTSHDDKKTQEVCNKYGVHWVATDCFTAKGHDFNKGQAINVGMDNLHMRDWVLHLDADIVLCRDFRRMLEFAELDQANIYGADRVNVYGYEAWQKLKPLIGRHYQDRWFIDPGFCHNRGLVKDVDWAWGARVVHKEYGWIPIGFFQLFHVSKGLRYNFKRGSAAGTDIMFPCQWPRKNRVLLPDVVVYHLDSEPIHKIGTNWKGRKSVPFAPKPQVASAQESPQSPEPIASGEETCHRHPPFCKHSKHCEWPRCKCHPVWCRHRHHCKWPHCHCPPYCGDKIEGDEK